MVLLIIHNPKIIDSSTPEKNDDHSIQDKQFYDEDAGTSKNDIGGLPSFQFAKIYLTRRKSLPLRIAAFHICTPDSPYYSIVRSFNTAMVKDERARVKMHIGKKCYVKQGKARQRIVTLHSEHEEEYPSFVSLYSHQIDLISCDLI